MNEKDAKNQFSLHTIKANNLIQETQSIKFRCSMHTIGVDLWCQIIKVASGHPEVMNCLLLL